MVLWYFVWIGLGIFIVHLVLKDQRTKKAERAAEAVQEPSLSSDDSNAEWTRLDQIALDIARHETLALWHADGRPIFRDIPVKDISVEGGWNFFCDDWGPLHRADAQLVAATVPQLIAHGHGRVGAVIIGAVVIFASPKTRAIFVNTVLRLF